jgi:hypothetical protein
MKGLTRFTVLRELLLHTDRRGTGIKEGKTHQGQYLFYAGLRSQRHRLPRTFQIHYTNNASTPSMQLDAASPSFLHLRLDVK